LTCCGQNSGIHGGSCNECRFLGRGDVKSGRRVRTFQAKPATHIIKAAEPSETLYILVSYTQTHTRSMSYSRFITLCSSQ